MSVARRLGLARSARVAGAIRVVDLRSVIVSALLTVSGLSPVVAHAADAAPAAAVLAPPDARLHGRNLAAGCTACHGTEGRPGTGSGMPALAGRPAGETAARLKAYKSATGDNPAATVMQQIAAGYSDAQIEAIAAYFAAQPPEARR